MSDRHANGCACSRPFAMFEAPGFAICEALHEPAQEIPVQTHAWATLCLTVEGGYEVDWLRKRLRCGPAALVFHPPGQVYGARISDAGSHCFTVSIDPAALTAAAEVPPLPSRPLSTRGTQWVWIQSAMTAR